MTSTGQPFYETGRVVDQIDVYLSFQIIGLFSQGLYSSPNKAIEELVSNAFDADATVVHTILSSNLDLPTSSVAVIDNGTGMNSEELKIHWVVGESPKKSNRDSRGGRRTIGKFGIGKLAAYVLGDRLTHITKSDGKYFSTSMDFSALPKPPSIEEQLGSRVSVAPKVILDLRELSEDEARSALEPWGSQTDEVSGLVLFGKNAEPTWTAALITSLKPMASELSEGRLRWVLSTAMPLRDDFRLTLNGKYVESSKLAGSIVGSWRLGNEIERLSKPAPQDLECLTDSRVEENQYQHWILRDSILGALTGYVEVYHDPIDGGKSEEMIGRSHGFFVYVHGRLINPDDSGFGIDRNGLQHGTFSRLRVIININELDAGLRSSRESLQEGPELIRARDILRGIFNFARTMLQQVEETERKEHRLTQRFADGPASLTERPILRMIQDEYEGSRILRHVKLPDKQVFPESELLLRHVRERMDSGGKLVEQVSYADMGISAPMSVLDIATGTLSINLDHPFVAHFTDEFADSKKNLPLELFALADILLEAELNDAGLTQTEIDSVLNSRDELLRTFARSSGARNSITVAQALINSASSADGLEIALVDVFSQLGFQAVRKAAKNEADGLAEAFLGMKGTQLGTYRVSLEAKSKIRIGAKVKKDSVGVSTIARHRDDLNCEHAIVVGPDFETGPDDLGAVIKEIEADRINNPSKTITLMRIEDLAKLVRIAPMKRLNLDQIRALFQCKSPDEAALWVKGITGATVKAGPHQAILEMLWELQSTEKDDTIGYGSLKTALRLKKGISINEDTLRTECLALSRMAPSHVYYEHDRVELNTHPEVVLRQIHAYIDNLPRENHR